MSLSIKDKPHLEYCHEPSDISWRPWCSLRPPWMDETLPPTIDQAMAAIRESPGWTVRIEKGLFVARNRSRKFFFRCIDPFEQALAAARFSQAHLHKP